jgi:hypothetical protein
VREPTPRTDRVDLSDEGLRLARETRQEQVNATVASRAAQDAGSLIDVRG